MEIIIKIFKALGILIAIPIVLFILLFFGTKTYQYFTDNNYSKIIKGEEFKQFESLINSIENLNNIAVLPNNDFIVLNRTVINRKSKTFGIEPELGFYSNYYSLGKSNKYESFDSLLSSMSLTIDNSKLNNLINKMILLELEDVLVSNDSCNEIIYRWETSAMWGEEGVITTDCVMNEVEYNEDARIRIQLISEGYYEYYR